MQQKHFTSSIQFDETMNESLKTEMLKSFDAVKVGEIVEGTIVQVTDNEVFVDIGAKAEGRVALEEFSTSPAVGEKVQVIPLRREIRDGGILVSYEKAQRKLFWNDLKQAHQDQTPVEGVVEKVVPNGFIVILIGSLTGFVPISKIDRHRVDDPEQYVGMTAQFMVERLFKDNKVNILLSRKSCLLAETVEKRDEFFETVQVGEIVEGEVKNFVAFGAFIDLGGFDGLLHLCEMSWSRQVRPKEILKKGQKIPLKVIGMDPEEKKISLSLRQTKENPWKDFSERYAINQVLEATVTKILDFGVFVQIEEGIEGLVHISEITWSRTTKHPSELFSINESVKVMILNYDTENERISLSIRKTQPDPWNEVMARFPPDAIFTRPINKITTRGLFVVLDEIMDAFISMEDLSWTDRSGKLLKDLKEGDEIKFIIQNIDPINRRIRASVKHLEEDPWANFATLHPVGSTVEGTLVRITEHGLIVSVPHDSHGIEGLVHRGQVIGDFDTAVENKEFEIGQKVTAMVREILPRRSRLSLSIRSLEEADHAQSIQEYLHHDSYDTTVSLGDLINHQNK